MVGDLLDHGDNVHDAELDLCPDLHDAAVHRDKLLRRHANQIEHNYLGMSFPNKMNAHILYPIKHFGWMKLFHAY
jgi:hypothetical protein